MGIGSKWQRALWESYREPQEPPDLDAIGRSNVDPGEDSSGQGPDPDAEPTAHAPNPWKDRAGDLWAQHGFDRRPSIRQWAEHKTRCEACEQ